MKREYLLHSDAVEPRMSGPGNNAYEVTVDVNVDDFPEHELIENINKAWSAKKALLESLTIEDIIDAIRYHKTEGGQWHHSDKPAIENAIS